MFPRVLPDFTLFPTLAALNLTLFPTQTGANLTLFPQKNGKKGDLRRLEFAGDFVEGNGHEGGFAGGGAVGDFAAQEVRQQGSGGL